MLHGASFGARGGSVSGCAAQGRAREFQGVRSVCVTSSRLRVCPVVAATHAHARGHLARVRTLIQGDEASQGHLHPLLEWGAVCLVPAGGCTGGIGSLLISWGNIRFQKSQERAPKARPPRPRPCAPSKGFEVERAWCVASYGGTAVTAVRVCTSPPLRFARVSSIRGCTYRMCVLCACAFFFFWWDAVLNSRRTSTTNLFTRPSSSSSSRRRSSSSRAESTGTPLAPASRVTGQCGPDAPLPSTSRARAAAVALASSRELL